MIRKTLFIVLLCGISYGITQVNLRKNEHATSISFKNVEALANMEPDQLNCPDNGPTLCATVNAPTGTIKYYKK